MGDEWRPWPSFSVLTKGLPRLELRLQLYERGRVLINRPTDGLMILGANPEWSCDVYEVRMGPFGRGRPVPDAIYDVSYLPIEMRLAGCGLLTLDASLDWIEKEYTKADVIGWTKEGR